MHPRRVDQPEAEMGSVIVEVARDGGVVQTDGGRGVPRVSALSPAATD